MTPLALLFALAFLVAVDMRILAPVLPSIASSLGASAGAVGLAMTSYALTYGAGQLGYGPLSDRLGRLRVVRVVGLGFCLCTALAALAATTAQFIAIRLLAGAFAGAVIPLTLVYIGDTVRYERRQTVIGRFSAVTSAAMALSAAIGGLVAHFVSWRVMLLGYAAVALLPVGAMWRLRPEPPPDQVDATARFVDFLRDRRAQLVYLAVFLEGGLFWGPGTYLGAFAAERHGLDQLQVGLLIALMGVGTMLGGLLMGPIRRRWSERGLAGLGGTLMGLAFFAIIPPWPWPALAAALLVQGFGFVCLHTTLQLRGTEISPTARGKAFALFAFNLFSGISIGTALLGRMVDAGWYETMFALAGGGLILIGLGTAAAPSHPLMPVPLPGGSAGARAHPRDGQKTPS
ncbi:MAG: MFS transporter [Candidatus Methylomirabilota bacterium]